MVRWCDGAMVRGCDGAMVQWCNGAGVRWCDGAGVYGLWSLVFGLLSFIFVLLSSHDGMSPELRSMLYCNFNFVTYPWNA